jgi:hypothetical protein
MEGGAMPDPFSLAQAPERRNWTPLLIGLAVVVAAVGGLILLARSGGGQGPAPDPYAQKLQVSAMLVSQARNFVGATVTYLDLHITNAGERTVSGGQAELIFRNRLDQVVQKETVPIRVLQPNQLGGYPDMLDLSMAPLGPGQTRNVRFVLDHVSSDWNHTFPGLRFINLKYR